MWRRRHLVILTLLWIHTAVIVAVSLALGVGLIHTLVEGVIPASMALLASETRRTRRFRATVASLGMASTSAILVHLSNGNIEMHFHFFVVVAVITLYQDWIPFLFAIGFVTLHHGVVGVLNPTAVYNHQDAWDHPWKWAAIHGGFVLAASVAGVVSWRLNEGVRALTDLILNAAGEGIYVLDDSRKVVFVNPAASAMVRHDVTSMMGWPEHRLLDVDESVKSDDLLPGGVVVAGESARHAGSTELRRKDGSVLPVDFVATPLLQRGRAQGAVVTFRDVTDRLQAEEALRTSEARFRTLFASNPHPMWLYEGETLAFIEVNDAAVAQYGYTRDEFTAMRVTEITAPEDAAFFAVDESLISAGEHIAAESRHRKKSGEVFTVALTSHQIQFASRTAVLVVAQDISERVRFEQQLADQALHDPLTGLPNRTLFTDRLEHAMSPGYHDGRSVSVLFLDLDGFKVINDSLGHAVGDELLIELSGRFAGCLLPEDTIARFGGDEFVVLLPDIERTDRAAEIAERLLATLRTPVHVADRDLVLTASIGLATHTGGGSSVDARDVVRKADIAMYQAKAAGKAQTVRFHPGMDSPAIDRLDLETDLRRAVEREEWVLAYQPEINLSTGMLVGMEALVRWRHPERGIVSPSDFITVAEETGLIIQIGDWVLREACRQAQEWARLWPSPLVVGVNVSALQLSQTDFADKVRATLEEFGLAPTSLRLEVTESTAMRDPAWTILVLRDMRVLGVELAIDDFGTGYSSLSYLSSLPVDILKIDQAFVRALADDQSGTAIVSAIVAVAHTLSMKVTAEGIETAEQLGQVSGLGCDRGQGYYLARPMAPEDFEQIVRAQKTFTHMSDAA